MNPISERRDLIWERREKISESRESQDDPSPALRVFI